MKKLIFSTAVAGAFLFSECPRLNLQILFATCKSTAEITLLRRRESRSTLGGSSIRSSIDWLIEFQPLSMEIAEQIRRQKFHCESISSSPPTPAIGTAKNSKVNKLFLKAALVGGVSFSQSVKMTRYLCWFRFSMSNEESFSSFSLDYLCPQLGLRGPGREQIGSATSSFFLSRNK